MTRDSQDVKAKMKFVSILCLSLILIGIVVAKPPVKYYETEIECLAVVSKTANFVGKSAYFCEECEPCPNKISFCRCPNEFKWKLFKNGTPEYLARVGIPSLKCSDGIEDGRGNCHNFTADLKPEGISEKHNLGNSRKSKSLPDAYCAAGSRLDNTGRCVQIPEIKVSYDASEISRLFATKPTTNITATTTGPTSQSLPATKPTQTSRIIKHITTIRAQEPSDLNDSRAADFDIPDELNLPTTIVVSQISPCPWDTCSLVVIVTLVTIIATLLLLGLLAYMVYKQFYEPYQEVDAVSDVEMTEMTCVDITSSN